MSGYTCRWEDVSSEGRTLAIATHFVVGPPGQPYDFIVSTSHPKDDAREGAEIHRLVESFSVAR